MARANKSGPKRTHDHRGKMTGEGCVGQRFFSRAQESDCEAIGSQREEPEKARPTCRKADRIDGAALPRRRITTMNAWNVGDARCGRTSCLTSTPEALLRA
jgi:hypothetical protein